ncbi:hypothetical protein GCM10023189_03790 [Nibrella saemangeumensis]|uniref:UspA domain-containing protein n=1 Tax=Nibrella saemangeumensis TaxID=1084526 RepID=A0ABP8MD08_9BACT
MKKILLLTDFSEASRKAIHFAQAMFSDVAAEFQLLHTYFVDTDGPYGAALFFQEAEKKARRDLNRLLAEVTTQPVPDYHKYTTRTYPGTTVGTVEWILTQEHFDYVVLGATGEGNNELFGSVATGIIRTAKTNVLVVPATASIRPLQQVVLATDYQSVNHLHSLRPLKDLLTVKSAGLTLLTIKGPEPAEPLSLDESRPFASYFDTVNTDTYFIRHDEVEKGIDEYLVTHSVDCWLRCRTTAVCSTS